jgi:hypothetical protein
MAAGGEGERSRQWDLEEEARTGSTGAEISTGEKSSIKPSHGESSQLLFTGERREREELVDRLISAVHFSLVYKCACMMQVPMVFVQPIWVYAQNGDLY